MPHIKLKRKAFNMKCIICGADWSHENIRSKGYYNVYFKCGHMTVVEGDYSEFRRNNKRRI